MITKPRIMTKKTSYTMDYNWSIKLTELQNSVFWLADEIKVEKDVQDIKVNLTESERHGVITTLKLFTLYETIIGNEYWGSKVMRSFPRPDIQRMASCFSYFELNVHAPFYNKINESLGLDNDDFYNSYIDDPILKSRMDFIESHVSSDDLLLSLAVFSMIEGAILYSAFAFLKHFQSNGKNKILNIVRGINFSNRDELIHSIAGASLFKTLKAESKIIDSTKLFTDIMDSALGIYIHECAIIDKIYSKGDIEGISREDLKRFVAHRINNCLDNLGYDALFIEDRIENKIQCWFYDSVSTIQFHDFFTGVGSEYSRNWDTEKFKF